MGNNNTKPITDWRNQLQELRSKLVESMSPEEKEKMKNEQNEEEFIKREIKKREPMLKSFLFDISYSLDIFFNNFLRKRKTESFDYWDLYGHRQELCFMRNLWDPDRNQVIVHRPIDKISVDRLINLAILMELQKPLEEDTVFYRGCISLEENGVSGIVTATSDYKIAEKNSKGTILSIVVPKGTKILYVDSILSEGERGEAFKKTIILPPCDYRVINETKKGKGKEPWNKHENTTHLTIEVTPLDLLEEFLKVLRDPPENYALVRAINDKWYDEAKQSIKHSSAEKDDWDRVKAGNYEETVAYLERYLERRNQRIKQGIKVYSKTNQ